MACEGILRSQFGRRPSNAVSKALERIELEEREGRIMVPRFRWNDSAGKLQIPSSKLQTNSKPQTSTRRPFPPAVLSLAAGIALLLGLGAWFFGPTMGQPVLAEVRGSDVSFERGTELVPATRRNPPPACRRVAHRNECHGHDQLRFGEDTASN